MSQLVKPSLAVALAAIVIAEQQAIHATVRCCYLGLEFVVIGFVAVVWAMLFEPIAVKPVIEPELMVVAFKAIQVSYGSWHRLDSAGVMAEKLVSFVTKLVRSTKMAPNSQITSSRNSTDQRYFAESLVHLQFSWLFQPLKAF